MKEKDIGMIGVGLLGGALAERLARANFAVFGFDIDASRLEVLARLGGKAASSAAEVASRCRRVVLSLPDSAVVRSVTEEMEPLLREGSIIIDTTTGDPQETATLGARLSERGVFYLDATVAGSSKQAREGRVLALVGGEPAVFSACADVLDSFATRAFHLGPCGSGARMKLVVNLVLGLHRAVLAEGLSYARKCGLDPTATLQVLGASAAHSRVMDTKGDKMAHGEFTPEARLSQHLKDVRLILSSGARAGAKLPLSTLHRALLERLEASGHGGEDNSAIIRAFQ